MSLSQKSRTAIYTGLTEFVDEQAVEEMLSFFSEAGLSVRHDPEGIFGRGLYIGRSRPKLR